MKKLISTLLLCLFVTLSLLFSGCSKDSNPLTALSTPDPNGTLFYSSPDSVFSSAPQQVGDSVDLRNYDSLIITYSFRTINPTVTSFTLYQNSPIYPAYNLPFHNGGQYIEYRFAVLARHLYAKMFINVIGSGCTYRIRDFKMYKK